MNERDSLFDVVPEIISDGIRCYYCGEERNLEIVGIRLLTGKVVSKVVVSVGCFICMDTFKNHFLLPKEC